MSLDRIKEIQSIIQNAQRPFNPYIERYIPDMPIARSYSDTQFEILQEQIQAFEATLDNDHEVGLLLTNFGQSVTMQVTEISYEEPVLMIFRGYVCDRMSTLIQHVSQLNFLLTSVQKDPDRQKRRIGFVHPRTEEE